MSASDNVTPVADWKRPQGVELTVPSGKVCLAQPASIDTFMQKGIIPNPLLKVILDAVSSGKPPTAFLGSITKEQLDSIFGLYDAVALYCVVLPKLSRVPADDVARDPNALYVDEVDLDDKAFIFQWAIGGTTDLVRFRETMAKHMGAVSAVEGLGLPAK